MEDLTLTGMQKLWGNKIKNLSLGQLTSMIRYKAENQGKVFSQIDKFYPSSKICSCCGNKKNIKLSERIYKCSCGNIIDRDHNAGINILQEGIRIELGKIESYPLSNSFGGLKDYVNKISKAVDDITNYNICSKETSPFRVG